MAAPVPKASHAVQSRAGKADGTAIKGLLFHHGGLPSARLGPPFTGSLALRARCKGLSQQESIDRLNEVAALVRREDSSHPISTIYGELPDGSTLALMPEIDVWGINSYRGLSFGNLFEDWKSLSQKPMFLAEYGADAYNALTDRYDPNSQAQAVVALTAEILNQASALDPAAGTTVGGTLFESADEWWKDAKGSPTVQDIGGVAPGGGPCPDATFNEEWWGLVDIDRNPRPAYSQLKSQLLMSR